MEEHYMKFFEKLTKYHQKLTEDMYPKYAP